MNNMLQALLYFFKRVGSDQSLKLDQETLLTELSQLGLSLADLEKIITNVAYWVTKQVKNPSTDTPPQFPVQNQMKTTTTYPTQSHTGTRIFSFEESAKLNKKVRGFLTHLEQIGILNSQTRESVIDQLMQLDLDSSRQISLSHTKWITFQTLFHDLPPEHLAYLEWMLFGKVMEAH